MKRMSKGIVIQRVLKGLYGKDTIGATVFALIAVIVSVQSCRISQQSLVLSKQTHSLAAEEFSAVRSITLAGTFDMDKEILSLHPLNDNCHLQKALVFYPTELSDSEWPVDGQEFNLPFNLPRWNLSQKITENYPQDTKYFKFVEGMVPITISSFYVAKGRAQSDKSLYGIEYRAFLNGKLHQPAKVDFLNLVFIDRLPENTNDQELLDQIHKQWQKQNSEQKNQPDGK